MSKLIWDKPIEYGGDYKKIEKRERGKEHILLKFWSVFRMMMDENRSLAGLNWTELD